LAVLTKVDGVRKRTVLQFLYESGLIYNAPLVLSLNGADLREANLKGTDLSAASLSEVDLFKADLSRANLINADLSRTNLTKANLSRADLIRTDLSGTNLSEADLFRADLSEADLSGARGWTDDQVESLEGATMPNGQKYEDWIKSRDREEDWGNE
jgi:uncharacterized protein YjbI with pentapeptide repeats